MKKDNLCILARNFNKLDWNYKEDWAKKNKKQNKSKIQCYKRKIMTAFEPMGKNEPYYETELEMLKIKKYDYESLSEDEKIIYNKNKNQ